MAPRVKIQIDVGQVFGELTVLQEECVPLTPGRAAAGFKTGLRGFRCRCSCGAETVISATTLASGSAMSCGCARTARAMAQVHRISEQNVTHGLSRRRSKHPLYPVWSGMMHRCYESSHRHFARYGGRGITVYAEWHDPAVFIADLETLLGPRPDGFTLDRIDNDSGYRPGNVRWASKTTQSQNRSANPGRRALTEDQRSEMQQKRADGATLQALAQEFGVSVATAHRTVGGKRQGSA